MRVDFFVKLANNPSINTYQGAMMDIVKIDERPFLRLAVENVTQPQLTVDLCVLTSYDPAHMERQRKLAHYMADQCKMLIPYYYELRNEMPRGRVKQMMNQRMRSIQDEGAIAAYRALLEADEFEFANDIPLRRVTIENKRLSMVFACDHDPDYVFFQREVSLPVGHPDFWAQVEAFEVNRLAEIELAKEKMGNSADNDAELEDEPEYAMAM